MVEAFVLGFFVLVGVPLLLLLLAVRLFSNQAHSQRRLDRLELQFQHIDQRLAELLLSFQGLDLDLMETEKFQASGWQRLEALERQFRQVDERLAELVLSLQSLDLDLPRLDLDGLEVDGLQVSDYEVIGLELDDLEPDGVELDGFESNGFELDGLEPDRPDLVPLEPDWSDPAREQAQPLRPLPKSTRVQAPEAAPDPGFDGIPERQDSPGQAPDSAQGLANQPPSRPTQNPPPSSAAAAEAALAEGSRPGAPAPKAPNSRPAVSTKPSAAVTPSRPRSAVAVSQPKPRPRPEPTPLQVFWRRIERLVVANWTGILGVVMVVAGVSFVTINMALTMGPQARFWLTVAAAAVLVVPSLLWGQRDPWQNLTAWMRSGGAALFLFACSAAGGVPDLGLTWQRDPGGALALLVLGGLANLLVAVIARNQTIAALHGVLTLVPLMIASPSGLTLGLGSLVGMVSLLLPRRRPWHGQRLAASLAYGWFQLTWVAHSGQCLELASPGGPSLRWLAAGAAIAVFGGGALLPHLGQERAFPGQSKGPTPGGAPTATDGIAETGEPISVAGAALPLQLLGLLSNWSGLGLALFLYPQSPGLRFGGLVLAWAAATVLSRRTPLSSRPWLGRCDTLAAQTLAIAALLSLLGPIANGPLLVFALFVEAVLFVRLGLDRSDPWIGVMGWGLVNLGGFGLLLTVLAQGAVPGQGALVAGANALAIAQQNRVLFLVAAAMTIAVQAQLHPRTALPRDPADEAQPAEAQPAKVKPGQARPVQALPIPALLGWLAAALAFGAAWCCSPAGWQEPVALASLGPLLLLARRRPLPGLVSGTSTAIVLSHGASWIGWASLAPLNSLAAQASQFLPHLVPLLALGLVMAASTTGSQRRGAILLIGFTAALGAFRLLAPLPLLALGGTWLALALVALLIAPRLPRQEAGCVLGLGLLDLVGASAIAFIDHPSGNASPITLLLLAASALTVAYGRPISRLDLVAPMAPLLGWLAAALAFSAAWWGAPAGWQEPVALLGLGPLLLISQRRPQPGLANASATALVVSHGVSWVGLLTGQPWPGALLWPHLLGLLGLGVVLAFGTTGNLVLLAIDLFGVSTGLGAFLVVAPLSPLAPPMAWLGLSLLALGAANRLGQEKATHALILGLSALLIAGIWGLTEGPPGLDLQLLGGRAIPARPVVDLAGLGVVLVWWRWPANARLAQNRLWRALRPWLVEVLLGGSLLSVALEVSPPWQPVAWSGLALALLSPAMGRLLAARIKLYSVLIQWLAIAALVTSSTSPAAGWSQSNSGPIGLMAISMQVLYVVASHRWLVLAGPGEVPSGALAGFAAALEHHRNRALYYPLFLGIALDLASRYDHSLLTLLWAMEAFVLFGLSALLRENQFRYLALGGLGGCLLRLVAVDMRQADMGLRGLVFIGVGLLMLAMNALYNRFRSRFEEGSP